MKQKYEFIWGVAVFKGNKKVEEIHFETEEKMALYLFEHENGLMRD